MVLPIGRMCCQHQHLSYLPIFGCIGCVQHHVGNVAIGERLYAFVTDRVRTSTSEWVSISLISFNFSVFRPLSRCSKLFNIILSKYFYFALRSCTAFVCPALSHIARYAPLLRQVRLHLSIAHASKLASLCIRFALTFAQNKQLRHNNAIQM